MSKLDIPVHATVLTPFLSFEAGVVTGGVFPEGELELGAAALQAETSPGMLQYLGSSIA